MTAFDELIAEDGPFTVPHSYVFGANKSVRPQAISATWDGSAAAGVFLPCATILSQDGRVISRTFPQSLNVGDKAEVTYSPFGLAPSVAAAAAASVSGVGKVTTLVGAAQTTVAAAAFSTTINLPAGIQAGDLLLIFATGGNNLSNIYAFFNPVGFTQLYQQVLISLEETAGNPVYKPHACFYRFATGTEQNPVTVGAAGNTQWDVACVAYRNIDPAAAIRGTTLEYVTTPGIGAMDFATPAGVSGRTNARLLTAMHYTADAGGVSPLGNWTVPAGTTLVAGAYDAGSTGGHVIVATETGQGPIGGNWHNSAVPGTYHRHILISTVVLAALPA